MLWNDARNHAKVARRAPFSHFLQNRSSMTCPIGEERGDEIVAPVCYASRADAPGPPLLPV
jgi:hypothetical protein